MEKKVFRDLILNYWRNVDKKILISFLVLFTLGLFFSFSSTSTLASERLDKDNYFFFSKHLIFSVFAIVLMVFISLIIYCRKIIFLSITERMFSINNFHNQKFNKVRFHTNIRIIRIGCTKASASKPIYLL